LFCVSVFDFNSVEIEAGTPYTRDWMHCTANMNIVTIREDNATPVFTNYELTDQLTN
jgi:hypothetical protein